VYTKFATTALGLSFLDSNGGTSMHQLDPLEESILRFCMPKRLTMYEIVEQVRKTLPGYSTHNAPQYIATATVRLLDHGLLVTFAKHDHPAQ
jgi:hypothetical protein